MRLLMINLLATAVLLVSAGAASAYSLSVVASTPTSGLVGDVVVFDIFLDTEGDTGLVLSSVSLTFNPGVATYRDDLSARNGYYPIYTPTAGKVGFTHLQSAGYVDGLGSPLSCGAPNQPATHQCAPAPTTWTGNLPDVGGVEYGQVNIDFVASNFPAAAGLTGSVDLLGTGTTQTQLATVAFELVGPGDSLGAFGFGNGGNVFSVNGVDVNEQIAVSGDVSMSVIPEPTTALLVGLGLVGLGVAGRRRA